MGAYSSSNRIADPILPVWRAVFAGETNSFFPGIFDEKSAAHIP